MVAIISGKGAGIENASVSLLGGRGLLGSAALGRADESAYVNAATGNLVLTDMDEMLVGRGPDAAIARTYNSLGAWDGDNDDYWRAGVYRRVTGLTGGSGYGTAGSTVKRTDWDGSEVAYAWSTTASAYVGTDGAGAYDTLTRTSGVWTWTDGDSQLTEAYDDANSGRITARTDTSGNSVTYTYTSGLITRVTTSGGEYTDLVYTSGQLTSLVTHASWPTPQITRIYYTYDGSDRLSKVKVNITPGDNSDAVTTGVASTFNYERTYTYDGASQRVATVSENGGALLTITYALVGSDYRVSSVEQQVTAGSVRTTLFAYDTTKRITTVTDPAGQVTLLSYDTNNNLTRIVTPPAGAEMVPIVQEFAYESDGDVASVRLGPGTSITYAYDANGNRTLERDAAGNTIARTYGSKNQLLTETHYLTPDPDGAGSGTPSAPLVTNYAYDALTRLRFVISPEGRVTEYRYDGFGQQVSQIDYTATYSSTMTEAALTAWVAAMTDRSGSQRTDTWYDFRGNVARTIAYATLDAAGEGAQDPLAVIVGANTSVVQQPDGLYRITKTAGGTGPDADARGVLAATGDFVLEVKPLQGNQAVVIGASTAPATSTVFTDMAFGIYLDFGSVIKYPSSPLVGMASYSAGDHIFMERVGSTVSYYKGATLAAARTAGAIGTITGVSTATMYLDSSLYGVGSQFDVGFTPAAIVNGANTSVTQQPDGLYRLTKTGGSGTAWDADARGSVAAAGDFVLRMRPAEYNKYVVAGVSTAPGTNSSYTNVNYGVIFQDNGWTSYTESGSYTALASYTAADNFWITRVGTTLSYYKGATLEAAVAAGALRTVTGVSGTFYFDSSFYNSSGTVDVAFTPGALSTPEVSRTDYVYDPSGRLLSRATAGQGVETFVYDGLGRITSSTDMGGVATAVTFDDGANTSLVTLANGVTRTSTYDRAGELLSVVEAGSGVATTTTVYGYDGLGQLRSVTDPDGRSRYMFYDAIGRKVADVDADGSVTEYRYDGNSNVTSTTTYANKLTSAQLASLSPPPAVVNGANTSVVQQSDGLYRVVKTSGISGWNGDARGTVPATGDFVLQVRPNQNNQAIVAGASTAPGTSSSYTDTNYGFYFDFGYAYYMESGSYASLTTYSAGDSFWMVRTGSTVSYYKGTTLAAGIAAGALRTVTGASTAAMYLDCSMNYTGSVDLGFTPATVVNGANTSVAMLGGDLYRVTKTAGTTYWDADARGTVGMAGDFVLQLKPNAGVQPLLAGISSNPAYSSGISEISNGFYFEYGNFAYHEGGYNTWLAAQNAGDTYWLVRTGTTLNYYVGATLSAAMAAGTLHSVTGVTGTQYFDSSLYTVGISVDVAFTAGTPTLASIRPTADTTNDRWNFNVYDLANRLVETIDGTGSVSQRVYDGASRLVSTTQRANLVSSTSLTALKAAATAPNKWASPNDGTSWSSPNGNRSAAGTFDGANAYSFAVAATGYEQVRQTGIAVAAGDVATFLFWVRGSSTVSSVGLGFLGASTAWGPYGENHAVVLSGPGTAADTGYCTVSGLSASVWTLVKVTRTMTAADTLQALVQGGAVVGDSFSFAKPIVTVTPSQPVYLPTADATNDRISRLFYDNDGQLTGALDAEGFLTETVYEQAGRKVRTIGYSNPTGTTTGLRETGTLTDLRNSITLSTANDIRDRWLYDSRGLVRATIDGEGNLTRYDYTPAGYVSQQVSGQKLDPAAMLTTPPTLANLPSPGSAILETVTWTYNLLGQKLTETRSLTGSTTTTTSYTYDSMHRLSTTVTQSGGADPHTYSQRYDAFGRLTSELSAIGNAIIAADMTPTQPEIDQTYLDYGWTYAYDTAGQLVSKTGPKGAKTLYYYNADGALTYEVDPAGQVVKYAYDAFGERTDTIVYAGAVSTTGLTGGADASALVTLLGSIATFTSHADFNVDGSVKLVTDPLGYATSYEYNAFGELSADVAPLDGSATIRTERTYDRRGLLKTETVDVGSGHKNIVTTYGYDAFGRTHTLTNALSQATTSDYDRNGRLVATTDALGHATAYAYDARGNLVTVTDALSQVTRFVYDKANRRIATIDALGELTTTAYDADGRVVATRTYKNAMSLGGLATEVAENNSALATAIAHTDAADQVTRFAYDGDGRLRFTIDALMHVVEHGYDNAGNEIHTIAYDGTIGTDGTGIYSASFIAGQISSLHLDTASGTRITRMVYDVDNRLTYSIDAGGMVTRRGYDGAGRLIKQTRFATLYATAGDQSLATMVTWAGGHASADDRTTRGYYDGKDQLAYSVDAAGFVTRYDYDKHGNVKSQIAYMAASSLSDSTTLANMGSSYPVPTSSVLADSHRTDFVYDSAGRLTDTIDYLDFAATPTTITTHLVLDAIGQITESTEANGTGDASTTAYTYDGVGRVTSVTRGSGSSVASTSFTYYDNVGQTIATVDGNKFLCTYTYDAAGRRTGEFHYANATTGTIATGTAVSLLVTNTTADSSRDASAGYTCDAFGNVVKTVDLRGNASFAYYDALNRAFRRVDAEKFVTDTNYGSFGEIVSVKRWATALTVTVTETTVPSSPAADTAHDATTSFLYDTMGRVTKATEAEGDSRTAGSVPTLYSKQFTYSAFGDKATARDEEYGRIADGSALDTTITYTYDKRGLLLRETLPFKAGDGTTWVANTYTYDALGNRLTMVEAYGAAEARTTSYTYDLLNRLTRTDHDAVTVTNDSGTISTSQPVYERLYYDRRGNVVETIDAAGAQVYAWYDQLDRAAAQIDALNYLTVSTYDKSDNLTAQTRYANKVTGTFTTATAASALTGLLGTGATDSDRTTSYGYDRANRLVSTTVASLLVGEWTGSAYSINTSFSVSTSADYDKAGNVTREADGRGNAITHWYDKVGREVARIDQENYLTVWTRDAEGNALSETRYANKVTGSFTSATAVTSLSGLLGTGAADADRTTTFTYDRNGHRLSETRAGVAYAAVDASGAVTSGTTASIVSYTYNGLGQVLSKSELISAPTSGAVYDTTSYLYDAGGRLTLETGQSFTNDAGTTVSPRTAYAYDGLSNLKSTRIQAAATANDTNDRVTTYVYGAGGRLDRTLSAEGFAALAAIGSPTTAQIDAIWAKYGHFYGYDLAGRTVRDSYTRTKSDGTTTVTEAQVTRYDLAGRTVTQSTSRFDGSAWVFTDAAGTAYDAVRIRYNAFGDVTGRGITAGPAASAVYQETFEFDAGGRMWRSNGSDGALRLHVYDKAGNETLAIASAGADLSGYTLSNYTGFISSVGGVTAGGAITTANVATTVTAYDKRGQALATRDPGRLLATGGSAVTIVHAKTYNAFGEVLTETGAGGFDSSGAANTAIRGYSHSWFDAFTTTYGYNTMGRMTSKAQAMVDITAADGGITHDVRPTEYYDYDLSGRLDRTTDANGNVTKRALLAGSGHGDAEALVVKEIHADGGIVETRYDVFGDARVLINEIGNTETRAYDKLSQLITQTHVNRAAYTTGNATGSDIQLVDHYVYDILGQRTGHWNSQFGSSYVERTDYDTSGRVVAEIDYMSSAVTTTYAWDASYASTGLGTFGGWLKTTVNKSGLSETEKLDYFGRRIDFVDFGGHNYDYTFDKGGRLVTQVNAGGESITYSWYNTGNLEQQVMDGTTGTYQYDTEGRRLRETWGTLEDATVSYDALGRMTAWTDTGSSVTTASTAYEYDAVGNVRLTHAVYGPSGSSATVDYWYKYDSMNRYVVAMGDLSGARGSGSIVRGMWGWDVAWNLASQRMTETRTLKVDVPIYGPPPPGGMAPTYLGSTTYYFDLRYYYTYTADGYLAEQFQANGSITVPSAPATIPSGATANYSYVRDALGRVTSGITYNMRSEVLTQTVGSVVTHYDYTAETSPGSGVFTGAYQGAVTHIYTTGASTNSNTVNAYEWWDSARQKLVTYKPIPTTTNTTTYSYDVSGRMTSAAIVDNNPRTIAYTNDAYGQIITRTGGYPTETHYRFNGREIGASSTAPLQTTAQQMTRGIDFDQGWDPIAVDSADHDSTYVTEVNDTLRGIAEKLWGDASLWFKLAEANGLTGDETFVAGRVLVVPQNVGSLHHNMSTFMPYDPNKAIGDTFPAGYDPPVQPQPPAAKKGCGMLGQILMIAVAVAITIATHGAALHLAAGLLGGATTTAGAIVLGGAISGIAGSIASQAFGLATGIVDKFSFKDVAMAGISGAIGGAMKVASLKDVVKAGLAGAKGLAAVTAAAASGTMGTLAKTAGLASKLSGGLSAANILQGAVRSMTSNALTQGVGVVTGLQKKFDFVAVAEAGVGAAASGAIQVPGEFGQALGRAADAIAGAATRSLLTGTDFGDNLLTSLPDVIGSTIGTLMGNEILGAFTRSAALARSRTDRDNTKISLMSEKNAVIGRKIRSFEMKSILMGAPSDIADVGPVTPLSSAAPSLTDSPAAEWNGAGGSLEEVTANPFTRRYFNNLISNGAENFPMGTGESIIDMGIDGPGNNYPWPVNQDRRVPGFPGDPPYDVAGKSGAYNSQVPTFSDHSNWASWSENAFIARNVLGMPHAAANMYNFLYKGGDVNIDLNQMISDLPTFSKEVDRGYLNLAAQIRDRISKGYQGRPMSFAISTKDFSPNQSAWTPLQVDSRESSDWYYALGWFNLSFTAFVTVTPQPHGQVSVTIKSNTYVGDRYNWDKEGTQVPWLGWTKDASLRRLKVVGLANDFSVRGAYAMPDLTWSFDPHRPLAKPIPVRSVRPGT